ncbi:linear amide C-N hydrolase [Kiritimatiellota bacterium B12222]|nr:linear amide C-N hydrolase [Kiritimatiellota bacterium B12222]
MGLITMVLCAPRVAACTRVVYLGEQDRVITARTMDWKVDVASNMWIFPRGMARSGQTGENSISWTSQYGSVITSGFDISTTDGINEKGLVANLLWLVESEYPTFDDESKPGLSISVWAQYVLDNFPDVASAVKALEQEPFTLVSANVPGENRLATLHLALSDASGDSAIIEYIDGKQVIHHNRAYQVMTNSPPFDQQLALNAYWEQIGGTTMLPGTNRAADRFVRASFYVNAVPQSGNAQESLASMFSVIRNVSVPYGISTPDQPNISSTRWRTVVDHKNKLYFFESTMGQSIFWVDLHTIDFSTQTGTVRTLKLGANQSNLLSGQVSEQFIEAPPFEFLGY